ncbi:MAG: cbhB [Candidatus Saccharibacteria bacterium]|nr:cbhB [Candidatus Saccharibacteria bacterium]
MENNTQPAQPKRRLPIIRILLIIVGVAIIVVASLIGINWYNQNQLTNQVKDALTNASSAEINQAATNKAGYSVTLPDGATTNKDVKIEGGGSFDGTSYCVTGTSVKDKTIIYHIDSASKTTQGGSCASASKPASTGPLAVGLVSIDQISVSWYAAPYADNYTLQCATNKDFTTKLVTKSIKTTNATCSNLSQGTTYYMRVRGNNQTGAGAWSQIVSATTTLLSVTPTDLKATATSSTQVSYSWAPVAGATSYIVEWSPDIDFIKDLHTVSQTSVSGVSNNLLPGTLYWYHVKAITASFDVSHAAFSPQISITTPAK